MLVIFFLSASLAIDSRATFIPEDGEYPLKFFNIAWYVASTMCLGGSKSNKFGSPIFRYNISFPVLATLSAKTTISLTAYVILLVLTAGMIFSIFIFAPNIKEDLQLKKYRF